MEILKPTRLLRRPEVQATTGLSRSSIYAKMELGAFPKPIRLGQRAVAWIESEIQDWLNGLITASRGEAIC